jgi:hypothetical protein
MRLLWIGALALVAAQPPTPAELGKPDASRPFIDKVRRVGPTVEDRAKAWRYLVQVGPDALVPVLEAMDQADRLSANWLRTAAEAIVEQALAANKPLPADQLIAFVRDRKHAPAARRLAYECLVKIDPATPGRLLPTMLDDPSRELRRDAVARELAAIEQRKADDPGAKPALLALFRHARDRDQVEALVQLLEKQGEKIDLTAHYNFLTQWALLGPFDNRDGVGFAKAYPPEGAALPADGAAGKQGPVSWRAATATEQYGTVDLGKLYDKEKGAVVYAVAEVEAPREMPVQVRLGSPNAVKVFVNGQEVFGREAYHHGDQMDQHVAAAVLKPGRNVIVVKVCQNEQTESWAQKFSFSCRVCDELGGAVPVKQLPPAVLSRKGA